MRLFCLILAFWVAAPSTFIFGQSFALFFQTPDQLAVCASDTFFISVRNQTGAPVSGASLTVVLPAGVQYVPGSVVGASEFNLSNLERPVFRLPDLGTGALTALRFSVYADCALANAINAGQLFSAGLEVKSGAFSESVTTTKFQIQTSLLVVVQVDNAVLSGEYGDVLERTIHVRNTRLAPVRHLFFRDTSQGGFTVQALGAASEQTKDKNYNAYFSGAFFSQFGNGDTLLDFGETVRIVERLRIDTCATTRSRSYLSVAWSCASTQAPCQGDSAVADVFIQLTSKTVDVDVVPRYPLPWDGCAKEASEGAFGFVNTGQLEAQDVLIQVSISSAGASAGFDPYSFRIVKAGQTTPLALNQFDTLQLESCERQVARTLSFVLPSIPVGDTLWVYYDFYYCVGDRCQMPAPRMTVLQFYPRPCQNAAVEINTVQINPQDILLGSIHYTIGRCLQEGEEYTLRILMNSNRLQYESGYVWIQIDLPWGLFWSSFNDVPLLNGVPPVVFTIDTLLPYQRVRMAFPLPIDDSLRLEFKVISTCIPDAYYAGMGGSGLIFSGMSIATDLPLPGDFCGECGYVGRVRMSLTRDLLSDPLCGVGVCDHFRLRTSCQWPDCVRNSRDCLECAKRRFRHHLRIERTNVGLLDANNDRIADNNEPADRNQIRLDRFMAGDTMLVVSSTKMLEGDPMGALKHQLFFEVARSGFAYDNAFDTIPLGGLPPNTAQNNFASADSLRLLKVWLRVWDSKTEQSYLCSTQLSNLILDRVYVRLQAVNIKPPVVQDELVSQSRIITMPFSALASQGCLPEDYQLKAGDSLALYTLWKYDFNYTKTKLRRPPLVNIEAGMRVMATPVPLPYYYRGGDTLMLQYTGVSDTFRAGVWNIRPCETALQSSPLSYVVQLARSNFFPYEIRPLSKVSDYWLRLPPSIDPQSAQVEWLRLQESHPLVSALPLPLQVVADRKMTLDFSGLYAQPLDEGYQFTTQVRFPPNCRMEYPQMATQSFAINYMGCINKGRTWQDSVAGAITFFTSVPRDSLRTAEPSYGFTTDAVTFDLTLRNLTPFPIPAYHIRLVTPPDGGLANATLTVLETGQTFSVVNGMFQLGTVPPSVTWTLRLRARNLTCDPQLLRVIFGWGCTPEPPFTCDEDTLAIRLVPRKPEVELELARLPKNVPLCDTSDYFELELFNADLGHAYKPVAAIQLPPGFQLLPGSCQMAYPAGSAWVNIPDPTPTSTGVLEWDIAALLGAALPDGLPGVNTAPQNALRIRFRVVTACGVVSNSQIILGAQAEWYCGRPSNILRKASDPIAVEGTIPSYTTQMLLTDATAGPLSCRSERVLEFNVLLGGSPLAGDSLYLALPPGYTYVSGSYVPGANAPAGPPQQVGQTLRLPLPAGLAGGAVLNFRLRLRTGDQPDCSGAVLRAETRQRAVAFCPTLNNNCVIYTVTGQATLALPPYSADLALLNASGRVVGGAGEYRAEVRNDGPTPAALSSLWLVWDRNGDGAYTPGADSVLAKDNANLPLAAGQSAVRAFSGPAAPDFCRLLIVLPGAENCACADTALRLRVDSVLWKQQTTCVGQGVAVGLPDSLPDRAYAWTSGPTPPCTACPSFVFAPPAAGVFPFTLQETSAAGCTITHRFEVRALFGPQLAPYLNPICAGGTVTLQLIGAVSAQWQGPGITQPNALVQTIKPAATHTYYIRALSAEGCELRDSARIVVLPPDTTDLGRIRTCKGAPVPVFNILTDEPGVYTRLLKNFAGCDSLLLLRVERVPDTEERLFRCPSDTVWVFGQPVLQSGQFCRKFPSTAGCDSTHCIQVQTLNAPVLSKTEDTLFFAVGQTLTLYAPAGYANYYWTPTTGLSCTNCPAPTVTPTDTATYSVIVFNSEGCSDTLTYRLFPQPPCDPARIRMPNAFTPDGDGHNDVFKPAPYEGVEVIAYLAIYNRWGQKIYESFGASAAWDGTSDGQPAPSDVYVWLLEIICSGDGERRLRRGDVTLLR
ncbi:MAG: gliding motility-associated C-terminal domain-containing protein [Saprospiraceae bacterium]|nr:gliding motility-associated C-terminal domain-containing protein [Saprospiraceae bacterium]MDW8229821.1 gliding motility-associated C-terminal domain-containing protein [Saprospiraceae bacterium]